MHCMVASYIKNTMHNNLCDSGVYPQKMINTFLSGFTLECELSEHICSSFSFSFFVCFLAGGGRRGQEGLGLIDLRLIHLHVPDTASLCVSVSRMCDVVK